MTCAWPTDAEVIEKVINRKLYSELKTPSLRLILERLEISQRSKKGENTEISSGLQIEHVLPQSWATYWFLKGKVIPENVATHPFLAKEDLIDLSLLQTFKDCFMEDNKALTQKICP